MVVKLSDDVNNEDLIARSPAAQCDLHALSTQDAFYSPLTLSLYLFPFPSVSLSSEGSWHETKRLLKQDKVIFNYSTGILAVQ